VSIYRECFPPDHFWVLSLERANIPPHVSNLPVKVIKELIPRQIAADLMNLMMEYGGAPQLTDPERANNCAHFFVSQVAHSLHLRANKRRSTPCSPSP